MDNFFDLGGDSIKAIQIASRAFQAGYKLDMKDLFQYPTVAALAPHMHEVRRMANQEEVSGETALLPFSIGSLRRSASVRSTLIRRSCSIALRALRRRRFGRYGLPCEAS
ncbi:phosphopantetheine-binding protein [Paenibacillus polymyxa]|uniref:phosphopantetheine-binding protein n=1 Tax=Paenibacillus polymyxa TaxID=1406 RepID=UPI00215CD718|nr:phosphopantetheine-binding protein [Paenibacillus polymyxa]